MFTKLSAGAVILKMHITKGLQGILTRTMSRLPEVWDDGSSADLNKQCLDRINLKSKIGEL